MKSNHRQIVLAAPCPDAAVEVRVRQKNVFVQRTRWIACVPEVIAFIPQYDMPLGSRFLAVREHEKCSGISRMIFQFTQDNTSEISRTVRLSALESLNYHLGLDRIKTL
jgi:hypothetical protein